jgi:SAM-dependent methyltransferase
LDRTQRDQEIAKLLQSEHVKYQNIDLGGGQGTGGYQRTSMDSLLFGSNLKGLTLLDIGSSLGHFCLEALKHGAAGATGLETSPERIRHAREIARLMDLPVEYIEADFESWTPQPKSHDVVLCLNVLHHLYEPIGAIRKIMAMTRGRFYLEVAPVKAREVMKVANLFSLWGATNAPLVLLGDTSNSTRAADRTFTFTKKAMAMIINGHSKAYEPVRFHPSSFKGRWIVEARRRQIDHLVVVAGVTGVGKSTFIEKLRASKKLRARFGIGDDFSVASANDVDSLAPGRHETLIYHYDVLRPFDRPLHSHQRDPAFHLLSSAKRVTSITLANDPGTLRQRLQSPGAEPKSRKGKKRHSVILKQYENPTFLQTWHEVWATAVEKEVAPAPLVVQLVRSDEDYSTISTQADLKAMLSA